MSKLILSRPGRPNHPEVSKLSEISWSAQFVTFSTISGGTGGSSIIVEETIIDVQIPHYIGDLPQVPRLEDATDTAVHKVHKDKPPTLDRSQFPYPDVVVETVAV